MTHRNIQAPELVKGRWWEGKPWSVTSPSSGELLSCLKLFWVISSYGSMAGWGKEGKCLGCRCWDTYLNFSGGGISPKNKPPELESALLFIWDAWNEGVLQNLQKITMWRPHPLKFTFELLLIYTGQWSCFNFTKCITQALKTLA